MFDLDSVLKVCAAIILIPSAIVVVGFFIGSFIIVLIEAFEDAFSDSVGDADLESED